MERNTSVFALFGGVRPMARKLDEPASNVAAWKRVGRIPAEKQPHVLAVGIKLGLPVTAEHVVFPLGRPHAVYADLPPPDARVFCDRQNASQRTEAAEPKI